MINKIIAITPILPFSLKKIVCSQSKEMAATKGKILTPHQYHQFNELRRLRNQAAHMEDFDLQGMHIAAYIDIALTLANNLENIQQP